MIAGFLYENIYGAPCICFMEKGKLMLQCATRRRWRPPNECPPWALADLLVHREPPERAKEFGVYDDGSQQPWKATVSQPQGTTP